MGTLLPDLIDKPLYLFAQKSTGSLLLHYISGTRTVGHTLLFLMGVLLIGLTLKSHSLIAMSCGIITHDFLDLYGVEDMGTSREGALHLLLWPIWGWDFPRSPPFENDNYLAALQHPILISMEVIGLLLLFWWLIKIKRK